MSRIRETIRHGDYHNVREVEIESTWAGMVKLLMGSPYHGGADADSMANNPYVTAAFVDLMATGRASFGWADYEILWPRRER